MQRGHCRNAGTAAECLVRINPPKILGQTLGFGLHDECRKLIAIPELSEEYGPSGRQRDVEQRAEQRPENEVA